eukprot:CAMPEP_0201122572 /NCGR_PEP_ID=MMETSP0850-20130426/6169_1 /ASSEMBLY_ACC=CAM_ASM_000622 /TAXON_ID=183588 /ORGANISM="Pseudo-nitzschia fraudulenta, Strain WWA7" /LENGTH=443 /DNA_ID=CAMNT_0047389289 /DNA_START=78 /DNA_END=1409 /DNA_ORIENTATION=+
MILLPTPTRAIAVAVLATGLGFASVEAFRPPSRPLLSRLHNTNGAVATATTSAGSKKKPLTVMYRIRCENKYYQLEELEDAENATTELFLKEDGTVEIGKTDGPLFAKAVGNWEIQENSFAMTITKTFKTGNDNSDMGEFQFEVERVFEGDMTVVGGTEVAINGKIFAEDIITDKHEKEVGFFNMIDGTDQRLERRADARPKNIGVKPSPIDSNDVKGHNGIPKEWLQPTEEFTQQQPQIDPALSSFDNSGYGQQQQQGGISAYGTGSFGQDAQGYGGGYGQQQQQQTGGNWGSGSDYGPQQEVQQGGISEYGGGSFGQESQGYGGGSTGGYGQPSNDPGPPSFANYGQEQQQQQYDQPSNDPGPPSFANYGQEQQQQQQQQQQQYGQPSNDPGPPSFADYGQQGGEEGTDNNYYPQDDGSGNNYNNGGGLSPMGDGGSNPWP